MFADTLLRAEHLHLFRLLVWGAGGVLIGTAVFVFLAWKRPRASILRQFGIQMLVWGLLEIAYVALTWHGIRMRDVSGATRLDRMIWLNLGLDIGTVAVGGSIALLGWLNGRRPGLLGAGAGVILQGVALFLINAQLAAVISR